VTARLIIALVVFTMLGAPAVGYCQSGDVPLLADLRWHAVTIPASGAAQPAPPTRQITIPRITTPPIIDGQLDDQVWQQAARTEAWVDVSGSAPARVQTEAWVARGVSRLFFALRCEEPNVSGLLAQVSEDGGPVWQDDCVELFFDGNLDRTTFRQIAVNSRGAVTCNDPRDRTWRAAVERGVHVGENEWTVELVLNIADLGIAGGEFGLNLCRERRAGGETELSCWSPTGPSFGVPAAFGLARLAESYLKTFDPGPVVVGLNQARVILINDGDQAKRLRVRLQYWQDEEIATETFSFYHELEAGATREVVIPYGVASSTAPVGFELAVLDQRGAILTERALTRAVQPPLVTSVGQSVLLVGERQAGLAVKLRVGPDLLRERGSLVVALFRQPGMSVVARQEIAPLQTPVMTARLALPELSPGAYSLHVVLKQQTLDGITRVAEAKHDLRVLASHLH